MGFLHIYMGKSSTELPELSVHKIEQTINSLVK